VRERGDLLAAEAARAAPRAGGEADVGRLERFTAPPQEVREPVPVHAFEYGPARRREGLIRHLGVSTVSAEQVAEPQAIAPVVSVQNFYNLANRADDAFVDALAAQNIAYVPYFPLGGFSPLQSTELETVAAAHGASPLAVALAWLLQRSPNILLIPGTSSVEHLRANVAGAGLRLSDEDLSVLDGVASAG